MCTGLLCFAGLVALPRYLTPEEFCRRSSESSRDPSSSEASRYLGCTSGSLPGVPGGGMTVR
jgi:hypothetical protein